MNKTRSTYIGQNIRLWIFKALILLSVFSFSGFNPEAQATPLFATQTELLESRTSSPSFHFEYLNKDFCHQDLSSSQLIFTLSYNRATRIYDNYIQVKYKFYNKKNTLVSKSILRLPLKMPKPSSEDDVSSSYVS